MEMVELKDKNPETSEAPFHYEVLTGYDDFSFGWPGSEEYIACMGKYNAYGIEHDVPDNSTSTLFMELKEPLDIGKLAEELGEGDIEILGIWENGMLIFSSLKERFEE